MTSLTVSFFLETTEVLYFKNLTFMEKKSLKKGNGVWIYCSCSYILNKYFLFIDINNLDNIR